MCMCLWPGLVCGLGLWTWFWDFGSGYEVMTWSVDLVCGLGLWILVLVMKL